MQFKEIARYESTQRCRTEAAAELALTLAINEKSAGRKMSMASTLVHRLPKTLQAMQRGDIDSHKASKIVGPTACLSHEHVQQVDEIMAGRLGGKTPTQLRRATTYAVGKVDPEGSAQRAARRRAQRRLELVHREDSMATITAYLPAEVAGAAYARIDRLARMSRGADESRTLDQLRADVFAETVLGKADGRSAAGRRRKYSSTSIYAPCWK